MLVKKIAIACDHAGPELKKMLKQDLGSEVEVVDLGTDGSESVDYPDYAVKLANYLKDKQDTYGILICGSGVGISIAANRFTHIRAALCQDKEVAILARQHNDANVLVLGARLLDEDAVKEIVQAFFNTAFEGGERHERRVEKLANI